MINIRMENPSDIPEIRRLNIEAFGQPDEAALVDLLRKNGKALLSLVAEKEGRLLGHILFSPIIIDSNNGQIQAVSLAPMAVAPEFQKRGIGAKLVRHGLEEMRRLGHNLVIVLGHPDYYPRFGFVPAAPLGIACPFEAPEQAWMALELREGAFADLQGTVCYPEEFQAVV